MIFEWLWSRWCTRVGVLPIFMVSKLPPCLATVAAAAAPCRRFYPAMSERQGHSQSLLPFSSFTYISFLSFFFHSCISTNGKSTRIPLSKRSACSHVCGIRDLGFLVYSYTDRSTDSFSLPFPWLCACQDQSVLYQCCSIHTCGDTTTGCSCYRAGSSKCICIFSYLCAYKLNHMLLEIDLSQLFASRFRGNCIWRTVQVSHCHIIIIERISILDWDHHHDTFIHTS